MRHTFNTVKTRFVDKIRLSHVGGFSQDAGHAIGREPQYVNTTPQVIAFDNGASITNYLLRNYIRPMFEEKDYHSLIINSYSHHLPSGGLYPNQPIWHCDYARQEDDVENDHVFLENNADAQHWYIIIGDKKSVPVPQFIDKSKINLTDEILSEKSWTGVSRYIDRKVKSGWHTYAFKPFELFSFRGNELYRSSVTTEAVNRFAMRITLYPDGHPYRPMGNGNGHRRNLHTVYVPC